MIKLLNRSTLYLVFILTFWTSVSSYAQNVQATTDKAQLLCGLGAICYEKDKEKSLSYFELAEKEIQNSTSDETKKTIYYYLYMLYSYKQAYEKSTRYAALVAPFVKKSDGLDLYALILIEWASDCENLGQHKKSKQLYSEVNDLFPSLSNKSKIIYYFRYGHQKLKEKKNRDASVVLRKGIELYRESMEDDDELLSFMDYMYQDLGRAYMLQHDFANALYNFYKSKDLQIRLYGKTRQKTLDYIKDCEKK